MLPFKLDESYLGKPAPAAPKLPALPVVPIDEKIKIKFDLPPPPKGHVSKPDYSILDTTGCLQSELYTNTQVPKLGESLDDQIRMFSHIHSDTIIGDSDLQGHSISKTSEYLTKIIKVLAPNHQQALIDTFASLTGDYAFGPAIDTEATNITSKLLDLRPGQSHVMKFGWLGKDKKPGHAMALEFVKQEGSKYQIFVYNTGSGTRFHDRIAEDHKIPICPFLVFSNVPESVLFFSQKPTKDDTAFIYYLLKAIVVNKDGGTFEIDSNGVYKALSILLPYRVQGDQNVIAYMTAQRGGTCSFRVLMAMLIRKTGQLYSNKAEGAKAYKSLKHQIKYHTLRRFYQDNSHRLMEDSPKASKMRELLKEAAIKFQRHTLKMFSPKNGAQLLSLDEAQKAYDTGRDLVTTIQGIEFKIDEVRKKEAERVELELLEQSEQQQKIKKDLETLLGHQRTPENNSNSLVTSKIPEFSESLPPERLLQELDQLNDWLGKNHDIYPPRVFVDLVDKFIIRLSIPCSDDTENYWSKLTLNEGNIKYLISQLNEIASKYFHHLDSDEYFPEQRNTIYTLYAIIHYLSLRFDNLVKTADSILNGFGVYFPFHEINADPSFVIYNPQAYERYLQIAEYFKPLQKSTKETLFNFTALTNINPNNTKDIGDFQYFGHLLNQPGVKCFVQLASNEPIYIYIAELIVGVSKDEFQKVIPNYLRALQTVSLMTHLVAGNLYKGMIQRDFNFSSCLLRNQLDNSFSIQFSIGNLVHSHKNPIVLLENYTKLSRIIQSSSKEENYYICYPVGKFQEIRCLNSEPSILPLGILKHYYENLQLLENPEEQMQFERAFFRHNWHENEKRYLFPIKELLTDDPSLFENIYNLVKEGLRLYYNQQPGLKPKIHAISIFIRVLVRSIQMLPEEKRRSYLSEIEKIEGLLDQWFLRKDLSEGELHSLYLHRLSLASVKSTKDMDAEQFRSILNSWLLLLHSIEDSKWANPFYFDHMTRWIFNVRKDLEVACKSYPTVVNDVLSNILATVNVSGRINGLWQLQFPVAYLGDLNREFWSIDLITGKIINHNGTLNGPYIPDFSKDTAFIELFGDVKFSMRTVGKDYYFFHPVYKLVKLVKFGNEKDVRIYRQDDSGAWWQYHSPNLFKALPGSLKAEHSHWMKQSDRRKQMEAVQFQDFSKIAYIPSSQFLEGVQIYNKSTGELDGEVKTNGTLYYKGKAVVLHKNVKAHFSDFEFNNYILVLDGSSGLELVFTRYKSRDGSPLQFGYNNNSFLEWKDNPQFGLAKYKPKGLIGTIPNAIFLEDKEGKISKVLIPSQNTIGTEDLSTHIKLDVIDKARMNEYAGGKSEYHCKQIGVYTYLEYNIKHDALVPLNAEGRIYKAYLELAQRNYEEGFNLLSFLSEADWISSQSIKTLLNILEMGKELPDQSPIANAIRLHLAYTLLKYSDRPDIESNEGLQIRTAILEKMAKGYEIYLDNMRNVPVDFRLNVDQELYLTGLLVGDTFKRRRKALRKEKINTESLKPEDIYVGQKVDPNSELFLNNVKVYINISNDGFFNDKHIQFLKNPVLPLNQLKFTPNSGSKFLYDHFNTLYHFAFNGTKEEKAYLDWILNLVEVESTDNLILCILQTARNIQPPLAPKFEHGPNNVIEWFVNIIKIAKKNIPLASPKLPVEEIAPVEPILTFVKPQKQEPLSEVKLKLTSNLSQISIKASQKFLKSYKRNENEFSPDLTGFKGAIPLKEKEKAYQKSIEQDLDRFKKNYRNGRKKNIEAERFRFNEGKDIEGLIADLKKSILQLENGEVENLSVEYVRKNDILKFANQRNALPAEERQKELLKLTGGTAERLDMSKLVYFFLKKDVNGLKACNPALKDEEITELFQMIGKYLLWNVELQKLHRALIDAEKYSGEKDPLARAVLLKKIGSELNAPIVYDINTEHEALVFEYQSNMRIRKSQFSLIKDKMAKTNNKNLYNNLVAQLVMGGGKTTVLASFLGYLSAKPDRLSLFIVPGALYDSVKENLKKSQKQNFGQKVAAIDLNRAQFSSKNLKWLREQFEKAIRNNEMLVVKVEMIQSIALELVYLAQQVANLKETDDLKQILEKIDDLLSIVMILKEQTDALGDEIDVLLSVMKEVNFPDGPPSKVRIERIELIKSIYKAFENPKIRMPNGKLLKDFVQLRENKQSLISEDDYEQQVRPALASFIADYIAPRYLPDTMKKSFERFVSGEMKANVQEIAYSDIDIESIEMSQQAKDDVKFLRHFRSISNSKDTAQSEAANLIALSRQMIKTVLSTTLTKNGNRHYGRSLKNENGSVVPYLGVGTPATTNFGYHYELIAYHYQTAAQQGVIKGQVLALAKAMKEAAVHFSLRDDENFSDTAEAKEFKKLTGVELHLIEDPSKLEEALKFINDPKFPDRALDFEANTIALLVTYYPLRFTSGPLQLVEAFNTFRAFSGTPWNFETFHPSLAENTFLDDGSDGAIAHELLERSHKNPSVIHKVESTEIKKLFDEILKNNPRKSRVRGFKDAGGMFKHADNKKVAEDILEYFKDNNDIQGVVCFTRPEGKETSDTPTMIKKGPNGTLIFATLDGTSEEDILKMGVPLQNIFYFYDERHCAGTDFPLPMDAISFATIDETITSRTFFQAVMRLRQLMENQDIEYVIHKSAEHCFVSHAKTLEDILLTAIKNQAIKKSKEVYRYFRQLIDHAFKLVALAELIDTLNLNRFISDPEIKKRKIEAIFSKYDHLLTNKMQDNPKDEYGLIEEDIPTVRSLLQYINLSKSKFNNNLPGLFEKHLQDLEVKIKESKDLPETVPSPSNHMLNSVQEVQLNNNVNINTNIQLDMDLKNELEQYQREGVPCQRREEAWTPILCESLANFSKFKNLNSDFACSLKNHIEEFKHANHYQQIFDEDLLVTHNSRKSSLDPVPIISPYQKPINNILIVKDKHQYKALGLSRRDTVVLKKFLNDKYRSTNDFNNIWLVQSDGTMVEPNPKQPLPSDGPEWENLQRILIQFNFFNGNIKFLENNYDLANSWLNEGNKELKIRFLKLKVENMPVQRQIFYRSSLFPQGNESVQVFAARHEVQSVMQQKMSKLNPGDVPKVPLNLIRQIPNNLVRFLGNDEFKIKRLSSEQVKHVDPTQVRFLSMRQVPHLQTPEQLDELDDDAFLQIKPDQIAKLSDKGVFRIANPDWLQYVRADKVIQLKENLFRLLKDDKQIKSLRLPELINKIPEDKFSVLEPEQIQHVHPDNVKHLKAHQIPHLKTKEQVEKLDDTMIASAHADHVKWINRSKYKFLRNPDAIKAVSKEDVECLVDDQIQHLGSHQVSNLNDSKIPLLANEEQIGAIRRDQVKLIRKDYYKWLKTKEQVEQVDNIDLNWLAFPQLRLLDDRRLQYITKPELLKKIDADKVNFIHKDAVPHLEASQRKKLSSKELLNEIQENQVSDLDDGQLKLLERAALIQQIANERLIHLIPDQVPKLKDGQFKHLDGEDKIVRVPNDKVNLINERCVHYLKNTQVPHLRDTRLIGILNTEQFQDVEEPAFLSKLDPLQVRVLRTPAIRNLPWDQVKHLKYYQTKDLPIDKLAGIESPEEISHLDDGRIWYLRREAHQHLSWEAKMYAAFYFPIALLQAAFALVCTAFLFVTGFYFMRKKYKVWDNTTQMIAYPYHLVRWYGGTPWPVQNV